MTRELAKGNLRLVSSLVDPFEVGDPALPIRREFWDVLLDRIIPKRTEGISKEVIKKMSCVPV